MIAYRNRLIFGLVGMIISTVFHAVYAVISLLKLQFVLLVSILWVILHFTGVIDKYPILNLFLSLSLIASVIYAVVSVLKALLGIDGKKKRRRGAQVVKAKRAEKIEEEKQEPIAQTEPAAAEIVQEAATVRMASPVAEQVDERPKYFRVKQNPELVMAEYSDRYELYRISGGALVKIRTDFK